MPLHAAEGHSQDTPDHAAAPVVMEGVSAREFIARVKASNPEAMVREAAVDAAAAEVVAARRLENPSVSYDREEVFDGGRGLAENSVRLFFPVDMSGRRKLQVKSAEVGVSAVRLEAQASQIDFLSDALKLYYRTAALKDRGRLLDESKEALSALM